DRDQAGILAGEEQAMKIRAGLGDQRYPRPPLQPETVETPREVERLGPQGGVREPGLQLSPNRVIVESRLAIGGIIQRVGQGLKNAGPEPEGRVGCRGRTIHVVLPYHSRPAGTFGPTGLPRRLRTCTCSDGLPRRPALPRRNVSDWRSRRA